MTEHISAPGAPAAPSEPDTASDPGGPAATPRLAAGLVVVVAVVAIVAAYLMRDTPVRTSHYVLLSLLLFTSAPSVSSSAATRWCCSCASS